MSFQAPQAERGLCYRRGLVKSGLVKCCFVRGKTVVGRFGALVLALASVALYMRWCIFANRFLLRMWGDLRMGFGGENGRLW